VNPEPGDEPISLKDLGLDGPKLGAKDGVREDLQPVDSK
jgi:hypothetical protein